MIEFKQERVNKTSIMKTKIIHKVIEVSTLLISNNVEMFNAKTFHIKICTAVMNKYTPSRKADFEHTIYINNLIKIQPTID